MQNSCITYIPPKSLQSSSYPCSSMLFFLYLLHYFHTSWTECFISCCSYHFQADTWSTWSSNSVTFQCHSETPVSSTPSYFSQIFKTQCDGRNYIYSLPSGPTQYKRGLKWKARANYCCTCLKHHLSHTAWQEGTSFRLLCHTPLINWIISVCHLLNRNRLRCTYSRKFCIKA